MLVTGIEICPFGSLIAPDGSGAVTTGDSPDVTVFEPIAFDAVTLKRILWLRSADPSRYVRPLATATQFPPPVSQRSQRYENWIGCRPTQVPGLAVITDPVTSDPWIAGFEVLTGGPTTTAVGFEATVDDPAEFVAVTRTRMRNPTSAATSVYFDLVAPGRKTQLLPSASPPSVPQRTQWYANDIGVLPVQLPCVVDSVRPCSARPLTAGSAVFFGPVAWADAPPAVGRTSAPRTSASAARPSACAGFPRERRPLRIGTMSFPPSVFPSDRYDASSRLCLLALADSLRQPHESLKKSAFRCAFGAGGEEWRRPEAGRLRSFGTIAGG